MILADLGSADMGARHLKYKAQVTSKVVGGHGNPTQMMSRDRVHTHISFNSLAHHPLVCKRN